MSFFTFLVETDDLFQDLDPDTSWGVTGGFTAGFPITNMQVSDISEIYRSAPQTGGYENIISIDLGAATPWNQVMFLNHDFDPSIVVTVMSRAADYPTSIVHDFSTTMTYREFDMYCRTPSTRTDRYIVITIVDAITAAHAYSFGRLMIGLATTLTSNFNYDWKRRRIALNRSKRTEVHARSVDKITKYFEFVLTFSEMTDTQLSALTTFTDALQGDAVYCFLILDPAVYEGYVVTLSSPVEETINRRHTVASLVFTEESRGVRIGA